MQITTNVPNRSDSSRTVFCHQRLAEGDADAVWSNWRQAGH